MSDNLNYSASEIIATENTLSVRTWHKVYTQLNPDHPFVLSQVGDHLVAAMTGSCLVYCCWSVIVY